MTCATSEDSDQPVFAGRSLGSRGLNYSSRVQRRLWSVCAMRRMIWVFALHTCLCRICRAFEYRCVQSRWHSVSRNMTKPTKWHVRQAKSQVSLDVRADWPESSLSAWRRIGSLATQWAHSEDSDQIGRMPRLIWVFARRIVFCCFWSVSLALYRKSATVKNNVNHEAVTCWKQQERYYRAKKKRRW